MENQKKSGIGIAIAAVVVIGAGGFWYSQFNKDKNAALPKIADLVKQADTDRTELTDLYQKRVTYLLEWEKAVEATTKKLPNELVVEEKFKNQKEVQPKSEAELDHLDMLQNDLSNTLTRYLQSKDAMKKKPPGLEKLEESINRKRHDYHEAAFEANALISKYDSQAPKVPVFAAEKALEKQGMWK